MKIEMRLAVLLVPTIGVLPRAITATLGYSTSAMVTEAAALRSAPSMCVRFGLFNNLSI